jgi:Ca2+-binding EF-hand superfamily protein
MSNKLALKYLRLLKPYTPAQIRDTIFSNYLETQNDGTIEFYEFIEIMMIIEQYPNRTLDSLAFIIKEIKTGKVCDPKHPKYGKPTTLKVPVMPEIRRTEFKEAFKFLDGVGEKDGVITVNEIITALRIATGLGLL